MHYEANIQNGIVGFLGGGTYCSAYSVNHGDLLCMSKISPAEMEAENMRTFFREAENSLMDNGMPAQCFDCTACNRSDLKSHEDHRDMTRHYRQTMRCESRGCDSARKAFLQNFQQLEKRGGKRIELNVTVNEPEPIAMTTLGHMEPFLIRPPIPKDEISLSSSALKPTSYADFNVEDFMADPEPFERVKEKAKRGFIASAMKAEQELEEIGELFDLGLITPKDQPADYGEVAW